MAFEMFRRLLSSHASVSCNNRARIELAAYPNMKEACKRNMNKKYLAFYDGILT